MARKSKSNTRTFHYENEAKGKEPFDVATALSDAEAIKLLRASGNDFQEKCADQIERMEAATLRPKLGIRFSANMVAWGFRMAEEIANPPATLVLSETVRGSVRFRKPMSTVVDGHPVRVSVCGSGSKRPGHYQISDGAGYMQGAFYGYADPDGKWTPRRATPEAIVKALTEE